MSDRPTTVHTPSATLDDLLDALIAAAQLRGREFAVFAETRREDPAIDKENNQAVADARQALRLFVYGGALATNPASAPQGADVNTAAAAIATFAQTATVPPQLFVVIVSDPVLAAYRSNIVGGLPALAPVLREFANNMESGWTVDLTRTPAPKDAS